jgi:enamine deaminase RidA (YjgF/YER057c/UK114 family)
MKEIINPEELFVPPGFSQAIKVSGEDLVFISGMPGRFSDGRIASETDVVAQVRQALDNIRRLVQEAGGSLADIVKLGIQVTDMEDYMSHKVALAALFYGCFGRELPAMTLFEVNRFMHLEVLVEIDAMAVLQRS